MSAAADSVNVAALTRLMIAVGQQRHALERKGMKPNVLKLHPDTLAAVQRVVEVVYRRYDSEGQPVACVRPKTIAEVFEIFVIGDASLARDAMQFAVATAAPGPALVAA